MKTLGSFIFTDKKNAPEGIMSVILGVIDLVSCVLATIMPYLIKAPAVERYAFVMFISVIMSIVGIILAIIGKVRKGMYGFFPQIGIVLNCLVFLYNGVILLIGSGGLKFWF